ncbi:MAG TPA: ornithine carbamoyltransferase, partial [Firmicutes bacterium]|nr:ornithine carbamoyltransferase [Bacillota bacterium]
MKTDVFKGRDFISELEYTKEELETILDVAFQLKRDYAMKRPHRLLEG